MYSPSSYFLKTVFTAFTANAVSVELSKYFMIFSLKGTVTLNPSILPSRTSSHNFFKSFSSTFFFVNCVKIIFFYPIIM